MNDLLMFGLCLIIVLYVFVWFSAGVSTGLAAFCVVLMWSRLVSAGLAAFCMAFCCFVGFVSADLGWSRCFLHDLGLVSASLI